METSNTGDLITAIDRSAEELHRRVEMHRCLVRGILEEKGCDAPLNRVVVSVRPPAETRLREAIGETIEVLEETRKAFKSKRLERLRKGLIRVLAEVE